MMHIVINPDATSMLSFIRQNIDWASVYELYNPLRGAKLEDLFSLIRKDSEREVILCLRDELENMHGVVISGLSEWDTKYFDINISKIYLISFSEFVSLKDRSLLLYELFQKTRDMKISCIFARIVLNDYKTIQALEAHGALLTDILITLDLETKSMLSTSRGVMQEDIDIHSASADEAESVAEVASKIFFTHFHTDPYLPKDKSDKLYSKWVLRDFQDPNGKILIAKIKDRIAGFASFRVSESGEAYISLVGKEPTERSKGVVKLLINNVIESLHNRTIYVRTQASNIPALKLYTSCGFTPILSQATLHIWLDKEG